MSSGQRRQLPQAPLSSTDIHISRLPRPLPLSLLLLLSPLLLSAPPACLSGAPHPTAVAFACWSPPPSHSSSW